MADEFDVIFKEDCSDNVITLDSSIEDSEYYVGESAVTFQIDYSTSVSSSACPITATLYIMDPDDGTWINYNSATAYHAIVDSSSLKTTNTGSNYDAGEFDISALFADKADYAPWTNYTFRVEVTDD